MTHSDEEIKRIMTWLREVLEKLGISQLSSVGGFSLGAYLTCRIALNAPDTLKSNAALFIAAPPASLSKFRFSYILPLILQGIVSKITGLPLPFRIATMLKNEYMREVEAGTAEMIDIDSLVKHMEFKDQIVKFDGTTPSIPFLIRKFTDDELQSIVDNFNPTYIGLEWDCWHNFRNCDIAVDRAKKAGMQTAFVEKTTHFVRLTQPHKFNKLLLEALDSSTMSS